MLVIHVVCIHILVSPVLVVRSVIICLKAGYVHHRTHYTEIERHIVNK